MQLSEFIVYVLIAFVFFLLGVFVTRWIFKIDKIVKHLEMHSLELRLHRRITQEIAKRQGITFQELDKIVKRTESDIEQL